MQRKESLQVGELGTPKWQEPLISYTKYGVLPSEMKEKATIRGRAPRFYYNEVVDILYYQSYDGILLRCLDNNKALAILEEMHKGICGVHQPGPKLNDRIRRQVYYWPTMIRDAIEYSR